jgi:hypothetical protein
MFFNVSAGGQEIQPQPRQDASLVHRRGRRGKANQHGPPGKSISAHSKQKEGLFTERILN